MEKPTDTSEKSNNDSSALFVPVMTWPEYKLTDVIDNTLRPKMFGKGVLYGIWPLYVEAYYGDEEPNREGVKRNPFVPVWIVSWDRHTKSDPPKGWKSFGDMDRSKIGYVFLSEKAPYYTRWSTHFRKYRTHWLTACLGVTYTVDRVSYEVFLEAYTQSKTAKRMPRDVRFFALNLLKQKMRSPRSDVEFWCARRIADGKIVGGIAVEFSSSTHNTHYTAGFYMEDVGQDPVMIGLMDYWHSRSIEKNMRVLSFGLFWVEGNPLSWKGFSLFKSRFGPEYVYQPPTLYKIVFASWVKKLFRLE